MIVSGLRDDSYVLVDTPIDSWDEYYFNIAKQSARRSRCLSRRIGAVIVRDKSIISTGYNGPPRGVPQCYKRWYLDPEFLAKYGGKLKASVDTTKPICPRHLLGAKSGELLDICVAVHAEENALLNAAWHGIPTKGATMFLNCGVPCFRCVARIINAGIEEVVVTDVNAVFDDTAKYLINESGLRIRAYNFE
jgi:dCMP deaminase